MEIAYTEFVKRAGKYLEPGELVLKGRRCLRLVISEVKDESVGVETKSDVVTVPFKSIGSVEEAEKVVRTVVSEIDPVAVGSAKSFVPCYMSKRFTSYGCGCGREEGEMMCKRHGRM